MVPNLNKNMEEKFSPLIDARNSDLWKDLNGKHNIQLEESEEPAYITVFEDDKIIIKIDMENLNPACLTHELFHIDLKDHGLLIARDLRERVEKNEELNELFSDSLKTHLGNCLEHWKMLPLYLNRGFKNQDFVTDYHDKIMDEEELLELRREYFVDENVSREAFDKYVGKFFSMRTSNNKNYDYQHMFEGLQNLDPSLYAVLEEFWEGWQDVEIGDPREKYQKLLNDLGAGLLEWKRNNNIVNEDSTEQQEKK